MGLYVRGAGGHVAERIQPEPGSAHETELEALAADPASGWRKIEEEESATSEPVSPPAHAALKPAWVEYAVGPGGMSAADAEALTKDQLIERFGRRREGTGDGAGEGSGRD